MINKKNNANSGDYVEVSMVKKTYSGFLLETPKDEPGIILLKLDTGYNIGLIKKDILEIKVIKKFSEKNEDKKIPLSNEKPNICLIITGGTIASKYDTQKGGVSPLSKPGDFFKSYPKFFNKVNVLKLEIPFMKASEDLEPKDWQKIAKITEKALNDENIKGVVITHGTDTLHYTSAALSFFLKNLNKPVVLTYSQRSIDRASSDADLNLQCSALAAISDIAEVFLVGHATLNDDYCYALRGCNVLKLNTSRRDAFKPVNDFPIAKIYPDRIDILSDFKIRNKKTVKLDLKFEEKVALIKLYPGQNPDILDYYYKEGYKGLVLEVTGLGQVPGKKWINKIKELQKKEIIICAAAQNLYGRLDPLVYSNGRELLKSGVIFLEDMLSTTALVKLGHVLGHEEWAKDKETVKEKMLSNFSGEIFKKIPLINPND
ncbi:Glu-tRNA(Gln) amidotransferase subunit GatD [Patescibacteria group bacterium]|nr:Glu-tRNA(Gln) amidotransferase subunit GatD [Patescibacteria group bacterium]